MRHSGEPARARIRIAGRVQGVGYRQSTVYEAERLGVSGSVRNLPDGSVEAIAEGARAAVEALVAWCGEGPPGAMVASVEVRWETPTGDPGPFRILRP
ncbi:MAG TPA: acylphosphatase [Anaeromyxobacteraceae bacterium]|nr:acylphosphatase [Anaeromyxobacteraceae bacterium]